MSLDRALPGARFLILAGLAALAAAAIVGADGEVKERRYGPPALPRSQVPRIIVRESEFDWGITSQGTDYHHTFEIENHGDAPLQIRRVRPSCGCSTVKWDEEIAPGASGKLDLSVDTNKLRGRIRKHATIFSNDPVHPEVEVGLGGEVATLIRHEPGEPLLSAVAGSPANLDLFLVPNTVDSMQIEAVAVRFGNVQVGAIEEVERDRRFRVPLTMPAHNRPAKKREILEVSVRIPDGSLRRVEIEMQVEHRDLIAFSPSNRFTFTRAETDPLYDPGAGVVTKSVTLAATADGRDFLIRSLTLEGLPEELFEARTEIVRPQREYRIHLTLKAAYRGEKRLLSGRLLVATDLAENADRALLVYARFVPPVSVGPK